MRIILSILMLILTSDTLNSSSHSPLQAAIVMDANTGVIHEEKNAYKLTHPASLTKIMTLYLIFEALEAKKIKLSTRMPVSYFATTQMPCKLSLKVGQTISVLEVIQGLVTKSANDAAVVVAEYLGGTEKKFAQSMTNKAHYLGMKNTIFKNASGLPNSMQVTTAYDMARLSQALYKRFPKQYSYFRAKNFMYKGQIYKNHNKLLGVYPGVDGIKTGYVAASGFNLAASALRNGNRLIVVVLGGRSSYSRDKEIIKLFDRHFAPGIKRKEHHYGNKLHQNSIAYVLGAPKQNRKKKINLDTTTLQKNNDPSLRSSTVSNRTAQRKIHDKDIKKTAAKQTWDIQGGRFTSIKQAEAMVKKVKKKYKLSNCKTLNVKDTAKNKALFKTLIRNMTEAQAVNVCSDYHRHGQPCHVKKM